MPPKKKGTLKRKANPPEEPEPSDVSSVASEPQAKKPKGLGRARARDSPPPLSLDYPESSDGKKKQSASSHGSSAMANMMLARPKVVRGQVPPQPENFPKHVSYNMMYHSAGLGPTHAPRTLPPRQERWKNPNKEPITEWANAPKGWTPSEPDLHRHDLDAQIERCYERIEDNILPDLFRKRLDWYLGWKANQQKILDAAPNGADFELAQRLHHLSGIQNMLQTEGDPDGQLPNVRALAAAYRTGGLKIERGVVTYWSKGVRLNEPTKFSRELHEKMLRENDSTHSFWVEGVSYSHSLLTQLSFL